MRNTLVAHFISESGTHGPVLPSHSPIAQRQFSCVPKVLSYLQLGHQRLENVHKLDGVMMCRRALHEPVPQYLEQPIKLRRLNNWPGDYIYFAPVQLGNEVLTTLLLNNACKLLLEPIRTVRHLFGRGAAFLLVFNFPCVGGNNILNPH
jgi:hypothetical protein